jgi:RNA polymerase III transcription factor (TF)IIIC subunit HTH domain
MLLSLLTGQKLAQIGACVCDSKSRMRLGTKFRRPPWAVHFVRWLIRAIHPAGGRRQAAHLVEFSAPSVPPAAADRGAGAEAEALRQLLQQRPAWSAERLSESLPQSTDRTQLEAALRRLCYRFKTGDR